MLSEINTMLLFLLSFSLASSKPSPTRPFTVAAFQSPYPPTASNSVSRMLMYASKGLFYASRVDNTRTGCEKLKGSKCPTGNETVVWVDREGKAFLDSADPQQIYIDATNGALSYLTPASTPPNTFSAGAIVVNFLHLGQGTNVTSPIPGEDPNLYVNAGPGSFNWLGSDNSGWFLCPQKASRNSTVYQVMKEVTVNDQRQIGCLSGIALIAIDYFGTRPAAEVYF